MKSSTFDTITCLVGEFLATALLLFLGCMGCTGQNNSLLQMALNFGFAVMLIIQCFGCVSGAHLNPAITLSAYIMDLISLRMSLGYLFAQLLGSYVGYALLMSLIPKSFLPVDGDNIGFCVTMPHSDFNFVRACTIEFIITSTLILFACSIWDPRNEKFCETVSLRFCLAVVCMGLTAGNFTGASMNPARSLAPALWNNNFKYQGVYWIGPLSAAVVSSYVYKLVFWREVHE
ncbi:aquaporin AQPcic-like [Calliphora vicina]|uniref:aquaporin AQPcic-like n=1 Tax=Calliphora vicina TaxID=7373 RepID=UPI00325C0553